MAVRKNIELIFKTRGAEKAAQQTKVVNSRLMALGKTAIGVGAAIYAARGVIKGLNAISEASGKASKIENMTTAFRSMGEQFGFNEQSLQKLRDATNDTMEDMDLLRLANNALLLGIVKSDDEMATLFDTAQRLAKALGQDTRYGVESLVTGMGRQSRLMLDNIGIIVKADDAYKAMAKSIGTSVDGLTDAQKKQAFLTATMESAEAKVKVLGEEELTTADATKQMAVAFADLKTAIAEKAEPQVRAITDLIKKAGDAAVAWLRGVGEDEAADEFQRRLQENAVAIRKQGDETEKATTKFDFFAQVYKEGTELMTKPRMEKGLEELEKLGNSWVTAGEVAEVATPLIKEASQSWLSPEQEAGVRMTEMLSSNLAAAVIHGQDLGDALTSSLKAIAIEMAANAAMFLLLQAITGGTGGAFATTQAGKGGFMGFLLTGFTGQTPRVNNHVHISGGLISDSYVRNTLVPAMNRVRSFG